jgi:hypothetical protein
MKHSKLLLFTVCLLFSGNIFSQNNDDVTLTKEEENKQAIIAWDGVKFGITKQAALNTIAFQGGKTEKSSESKFPIDKIKMSDKKSSEYRKIMDLDNRPEFTAYFGGAKSDELFAIDITLSASMSVDGYHSLKKDANKIIHMLQNTYGKKVKLSISENDQNSILQSARLGTTVYKYIGAFECGNYYESNYVKKISMRFDTYNYYNSNYKNLLLIVTIENEKYPTTKWKPSYDKAKAEIQRKEANKQKQKNLF